MPQAAMLSRAAKRMVGGGPGVNLALQCQSLETVGTSTQDT